MPPLKPGGRLLSWHQSTKESLLQTASIAGTVLNKFCSVPKSLILGIAKLQCLDEPKRLDHFWVQVDLPMRNSAQWPVRSFGRSRIPTRLETKIGNGMRLVVFSFFLRKLKLCPNGRNDLGTQRFWSFLDQSFYRCVFSIND